MPSFSPEIKDNNPLLKVLFVISFLIYLKSIMFKYGG